MEKPTRFRLGIAAAALAGAAFGGVALGPVLAGAQQPSEDTTTTAPEGRDDGRGPDRTDCAPPEGLRHFRFGGPGHLDVAAEAIGIEPDALHEALREGRTVAEVAEANGVEVQDVVDAVVAEARERLSAAVADGRLTQEEADELGADVEERVTDLVEGRLPEGGPGRVRPGHGPGRGHGVGPRGERADGPADG